ncbi:MAG: hypothetical protein Q9196_003574 [Gyalolechia fulgens]
MADGCSIAIKDHITSKALPTTALAKGAMINVAPAEERPQDTAQEWIRECQAISSSPDPSRRLEVCEHWFLALQIDNICVFKNNTKAYSLKPTSWLLNHQLDGGPETDPCTIRWDPDADPDTVCDFYFAYDSDEEDWILVGKPPEKSKSNVFSTTSGPKDADIFVALGYLREANLSDEEQRRTTNFVVMLNLTTVPTSVWLMFDYHMDDYEEGPLRLTNRLCNTDNMLYEHELRGRKDATKAQDDFASYEWVAEKHLNAYKNFHRQYTNITQYINITGDGSRRHPIKDVGTTANTARVRNSSPDASPKSGHATSSESSEKSTPSVAKSFDCRSERTKMKTSRGNERGYFGLPQFDLVLLAPDINTWSTEGFDQRQVWQCLQSTRMLIGPSLRAQSMTGPQEYRFGKTRVDIKDLCIG